MANIGLSQPYYAKLSGTTYSGLAKLGKATTVNVTTEGKEPTKLYADNGVAESMAIFGGGTVTIGIDELSLAVAADILGLTAPGQTGGITFTGDAVAPYVGLGFIIKKVKDGVVKWRVVTLYKCQFMMPDFSVNTQGESIEFQTPELEAQILMDASASPKWATWADYETEAAALTALQANLGS